MNRKKNSKTSKSIINQKTIIIVGAIFVVITLFTLFSKKNTSQTLIKDTPKDIGGDLTIIKSDVTEEAKFYGYQSNDTYIEVLAVRASDGTVRTALNTCQVCNNSGRGYYVQEGNVLICQNCGNQFTIDQIELIKNGCNPVPIEQNIKTEDEEKIVIQEDALAQYEPLFTVWKS